MRSLKTLLALKALYLKQGAPVISTRTQAQVQTLDHDFPSAVEGKLIPHGIYDLARNEGYMHLNTSVDTSEFCCASIAHWWMQHGHQQYPKASRLLVLCDGGGSNAANWHVFRFGS